MSQRFHVMVLCRHSKQSSNISRMALVIVHREFFLQETNRTGNAFFFPFSGWPSTSFGKRHYCFIYLCICPPLQFAISGGANKKNINQSCNSATSNSTQIVILIALIIIKYRLQISIITKYANIYIAHWKPPAYFRAFLIETLWIIISCNNRLLNRTSNQSAVFT